MKNIILVLAFSLIFYGHNLLAAQYQATVQWKEVQEITSPLSGIIKTVNIAQGSLVDQNDVLVEYDSLLIDSCLKTAGVIKDQSKFNLEEAKREQQRAEDLYDRTVLSDHDLQLARLSYKTALAEFQEARHKLVKARWNKQYSQVKAPYKGLVLTNNTFPGQYITNKLTAQSLLSLARIDQLQALLTVTVDQAGNFQTGQKATITSSTGTQTGHVALISNQLRDDKIEIIIDFDINNKESLPMIGETVQISF